MSGSSYRKMIAEIVGKDRKKADEAEKVRQILTKELDQGQKNDFDYLWEFDARENQLPPAGDWRVWMIMAGRGFGKTRAGAEWVRMIADSNPEARIALVSASLAEARAVMVEGESGLLAICRPSHKPHFEPSLHRVRFANGALAQLFSAAEPETLRGPQHSHACRAGAEGVCRQRSAVPARCAARPRCDRLAARPARQRGRWRLLPRDGDSHGALGGSGRPNRRAHCRRMAVRRPGRRDAAVRPERRRFRHLPVAMAAGRGGCRGLRRHGHRRSGAGRADRTDLRAQDHGCARRFQPLRRANGGLPCVLRLHFYPQGLFSDILATPEG